MSDYSTHHELLIDVLRGVSRSFYLTLRVLPEPIRHQIGLAYLLARATDTIADTDVVPVKHRLAALASLRERIAGGSRTALDLREFIRVEATQTQATASEQRLLARIDQTIELLEQFTKEDQKRIRDVLAIITAGQELDLRRFDGAGEDRIIALSTGVELEDYTYRVAGCVGEFWTRMCVAHLFPTPVSLSRERNGDASNWFEQTGVEFGKGLQLVNILRDLPRDLRQGRCYLPLEELQRAGMTPRDLLVPEQEARMRSIYDRWLERTNEYLESGWEYTCAVPRRSVRVRLACAWPLLIGLRTLEKLRGGSVLDPKVRIKVSRSEVYWIMLKSILALPFPGVWERIFVMRQGRGV